MPFGAGSACGISRERRQRAAEFLRNAACLVVDSALQYRAARMKDTNTLSYIIMNRCNSPGSKLGAVNEDSKLKVPNLSGVLAQLSALCPPSARHVPGSQRNMGSWITKKNWDPGSQYTVSRTVFLPMTQDPQDPSANFRHKTQDPQDLGAIPSKAGSKISRIEKRPENVATSGARNRNLLPNCRPPQPAMLPRRRKFTTPAALHIVVEGSDSGSCAASTGRF